MRSITRRGFAALGFALSAAGCGSSEKTPTGVSPVASVVVSPHSATLRQSATVQLEVTVKDASGNVLTGRSVDWHSNDAAKVTVTAGGMATGVGLGAASVVADVDGYSDAATVLVAGPAALVSKVSGDAQTTPINTALAAPLVVRVTDANGTPVSGATVVWSAASGTVSSASTTSGNDGQTQITFTPTSGGAQQISAKVGSLPAAVFTATATITLSHVSRIAPGIAQSCALAANGSLYCWGQYAIVPAHPTPTALFPSLHFASVTGGEMAECGLLATGDGYCWNFNDQGQVGDGSLVDRWTPSHIAGPQLWQRLSAGRSTHCALEPSGVAWCWGNGDQGQLGNGDTLSKNPSPVQVSTSQRFTFVQSGGEYTCGLTAAGAAWCWGINVDAALGDGTTTRRLTPVAVSGGHTFSSLAPSTDFACGLQGTDTYCWGTGWMGTGGYVISQTAPLKITGAPAFTSLIAAGASVCGLTSAHTLYCWGDNGSGETGQPAGPTKVPTLVPGGHLWAEVAATLDHMCGRTTAGEMWCWGANWAGQLGDGTKTASSTPVKVAGNIAW